MAEDVAQFTGVPQRVDVPGGVVVRGYTEDDIPQLVEVINRNIDHLRPWLPWAQEATTVESQMSWWRESAKEALAGREFVYGVFAADGRLVGGTGFHARSGPDVLEIGYWLAADATGQGLMTRVVAALVDAARGVDGVRRIEIKCDEANDRSAAIPRRLGFRKIGVEERPISAASETGRHEVWALDLNSP